MFQIWEAGHPATFIAKAGTLDMALDKVDTLCRLRHDQALADIDTPRDASYRFEVRDHRAQTLAWLTYRPDRSRPYKSIIVDELLRESRRSRPHGRC